MGEYKHRYWCPNCDTPVSVPVGPTEEFQERFKILADVRAAMKSGVRYSNGDEPLETPRAVLQAIQARQEIGIDDSECTLSRINTRESEMVEMLEILFRESER